MPFWSTFVDRIADDPAGADQPFALAEGRAGRHSAHRATAPPIESCSHAARGVVRVRRRYED